jgi:hypothetical protein
MYLLEICIYRFCFVKVHIFWEGHKIFAKSSPYFWLALHRTKVRWRFDKFLWPSQNIWTTEKFLRNISWKDRYMKDRLLLRKDFTPWCCTLVRSLLIHTYVPLYWYTMDSKAFRGCRDCWPKFATGLKCLNRHRSKRIWVTSLLFCQNASLMGESLWQKDSLVTFILFELCLFWYLAQSQILGNSLYLQFIYRVVYSLKL